MKKTKFFWFNLGWMAGIFVAFILTLLNCRFGWFSWC